MGKLAKDRRGGLSELRGKGRLSGTNFLPAVSVSVTRMAWKILYRYDFNEDELELVNRCSVLMTTRCPCNQRPMTNLSRSTKIVSQSSTANESIQCASKRGILNILKPPNQQN